MKGLFKRIAWQDALLPTVLSLTGLTVLLLSWAGMVNLDQIRGLWPVTLILVGLAELARFEVPERRNGHE